MFIISGKSGSGKDSILNILTSAAGFRAITLYTTRPSRDGEIQDVTYHYITEHDFWRKIQNSFFAEYRRYDTALGTWYYGTAWEDILKADDNTVVILPPDAALKIRDILPVKPTLIYICANGWGIKRRLKKRGDSRKEIRRRYKADNKLFDNYEAKADKCFYNRYPEDIGIIAWEICGLVREEAHTEKGD